MSRISLPKVSDLTAEQSVQYERFPANLTLALLKTTNSTAGYLSLGASFPHGSLSDKDREMIILRIAALSNSSYEKMQHFPHALQAGWSESVIAEIEEGKASTKRYQAILDFVDECVLKVRVSDEVFATVRSFYSETQVAELALMIGHYMMTARFLEVLKVPLDTKETSWENM